jgi:hypothetical protein
MRKLKVRRKIKDEGSKTEEIKLLAYLTEKNGYPTEDEMLEDVSLGQTVSLKLMDCRVSAWGHLSKSAVIHFLSSTGPKRITQCYVVDLEE